MIADALQVGIKVDIIPIVDEEGQKPEYRVYYSQIQNLEPEGFLEINMPQEAGRLVLLSVGVRYDLVFYTKYGAYTCVGEVAERYKMDNIYLLLMELKTELVKFQRREYFRCECGIDFQYHVIPQEEIENGQIQQILRDYAYHVKTAELTKGIMVDISGGGARFKSKIENQKDCCIRMKIPLNLSGKGKDFNIIARIIKCEKILNVKDFFENRVQFISLSDVEREQIIRFIFEEERKARKLNKG